MGARISAGGEGHSTVVMMARVLIGGCLLAVVTLSPTVAASQEASSQDQNANTGNDLFRPPPNLFQMMSQYKTAPGSGSTPGSTREVTTDTLNLRFDHSLDLASQWILALRTDLPLLAKNPITSDNPNGDYVQGVGDADVQAILLHNLDQRWTIGFGARLTAPTGDDMLGSGKWQIMPAAGVRYALPEINSSSYLEPVVRYNVSFAGDPTKKNISNLQFAPTFNLGLPDRWFITFYPSADIRINYGDAITGQTGRLFLPFDVRIGRKLSDNAALSLEVGVPIVRDYPVYDFKTELRLNVTY
jgi:Putative MetA-pathway of phenol degradation